MSCRIDGDVAGDLVEAVLEPQPQILERVEDAVRAGEIGVVVARGEAQRVGLDPGHVDPSAGFVADGDGRRTIRLLARPGALRSRSSSVRTPMPIRASWASSRLAAGDTAVASGIAELAAATGSKKNVSAPSGVSSTDRRPPRIGNAAALAARAAHRHQARLGRDDLCRRLDLVAGLRGEAPGAEQRVRRLQLRDPLQHLLRGQLAVAAGTVDGGDQVAGRIGISALLRARQEQPRREDDRVAERAGQPRLVPVGEHVPAHVEQHDRVAAELRGRLREAGRERRPARG